MDGCPPAKAHNRDTVGLIEQGGPPYAEFKPGRGGGAAESLANWRPRNVEALAKLSRSYRYRGIDQIAFQLERPTIQELPRSGKYARQAIKVDPDPPGAISILRLTLGTMAGVSPIARQIEMADEIRAPRKRPSPSTRRTGLPTILWGLAPPDGVSWQNQTHGASLGMTALCQRAIWNIHEFSRKSGFHQSHVIVSRANWHAHTS